MGRTILFTPVGGTDPISETNLQDGSMLHICREYKPDKVVLYMSDEILSRHRKDNRYILCLEKLAELQKRSVQYEIIERAGLVSVQAFDYFYKDFSVLLSQIKDEMEADDRLLINISSGTPSMKSSLVVLCTLGEVDAKMVQVKTPEKKMNQHFHSANYDVDALWENNTDNFDDAENRCEEIVCPTLSDLMKKEIIRKHLKAYDYHAAVVVADTLLDLKASLRNALQMAEARYLMKNTVDAYIREGVNFSLPVKTGKYRDCFEYALVSNVKLKKGEYADFIRSVTPLITDLFELVLSDQFKINIDDYCTYEYKKENNRGHFLLLEEKELKKVRVRRWDMNKLQGTEAYAILNSYYKGGFYARDISSDHLIGIIDGKTNDSKLLLLVYRLRMVEERCRNLAAHEIVSITDKTIKDLTGYSPERISKMIRDLFLYTNARIKEEYWNSYDDMNELLYSLLD